MGELAESTEQLCSEEKRWGTGVVVGSRRPIRKSDCGLRIMWAAFPVLPSLGIDLLMHLGSEKGVVRDNIR
jgi:hypothetical protein